MSLVVVLLTRQVSSKAKIMVQNEVVEVVDLSKEDDQDFYIEGTKGTMHVHTHDGAIAVVCPHQDCVNMGYVKDSGHPIICAYNEVTIIIEGASSSDVELG